MQGKVLILGKDGQMGRALTALLGDQALAAGRSDVDFLRHDFISDMERFTGGQTITSVINASAYTQVDKAEGDGRDEAFRINATAVGKLALWCSSQKLPLVHYSTDYVFDGSGDQPRRETDKPHPLNAYGQSKLLGEEAVAQAGGAYVIVRTSWVYDAMSKNFFTTIRRLLAGKPALNVVSDQVGAPTYAAHLAQATLPMIAAPSGAYHLCNGGQTSWYGFAQAIFEEEKKRGATLACQSIQPIPTSQYPLPAPRPLNSRLDCSKAAALGVALPSWEDGLKDCFAAAI